MRKAVRTTLFLLLVTMATLSARANDYTLAYIEQYKTIVINEMQRTGIPASIKMAQAILESGSGRSTLAKQSNNHFGIKCGKDWKGKEVYRHDDDYRDGLLVRSCFRAYDDPYDSFIAHSDFLSNPYSKRYKFLFNLDPTDYNAWAHGLKKAGYATDPAYPSKLISLIEKYQLYTLDQQLTREAEELIAFESQSQDVEENETITDRETNPRVIASASVSHHNSSRNASKGTHIFRQGETMENIAALHKIPLKELYFKNRMAYGAIPKVGEELVVDRYIHFKKRPATLKQKEANQHSTYLFEEEITISSL